ncbi:DUF4145 domain-containing protein [Phytohabitans suffuscus]|uniref:Protein kinase domain-containing protein n=1 Tax=Phytohabitans suffuscus TaxID=624315 RepID=A0A6F8YC80_9ACTN|nr:DUF4145 domain-containing protein [Phytohabitans suffuscus]BCB83725.1 hypothetical protein Psuf_010380 [Phytohabitans suffuscus]
MTDQVMDLVAASPNFRFLADSSIHLAGDGATAEAYVYSDPDAALARARRFAETLVKLVMLRSGLAAESRPSFARDIQALHHAGLISESLRQTLDQIRRDGNQAVHARSGDSEKASAAVRACFELGLWWHGTETGREIQLVYTPLAPGVGSTPELLQKVERQLAGLQATLDAGLVRSRPEEEPARAITIGTAGPDRHRWRAGSAIECGAFSYLLHEPIDRIEADDGSWTLMEADGRAVDAQATPARLRAVLAAASGAATTRMIEGLAAQAAYLRERDRSRSLPELLTRSNDEKLHVTVTTRPDGVTWHEAFDGGGQPLDPLIVPLAVDALVSVADALTDLHRKGAAHRALNGGSILVTRSGRRGVLRDLGLAWWPPLRGEGGVYRAPEQRSVARGRPGPATDVFQLAALLHHACSGIRPGTGPAGRLGILLPGFPEQLDTLLADALDSDPARRPDAAAFATGLRQGRRALAVEATHGH